MKIIILISLFKAFKYRRYSIIFNINNKLYNYIRDREYHIFIIAVKKNTSLISIIIIITIIIETFSLTISIITSLISLLILYFINPPHTPRINLSSIYRVILSSLSIYRANSSISLYNLEFYLIV